MESPTGIIPEELMFPELKDQVVTFLVSQPLPPWTKRRLLAGWSTTVGVFPTALDYHLLEISCPNCPIPAGATK